MLKHYIIIALKNIKRFRLFSCLNVLGLSISMAVAMALLTYSLNELNVDKHISNVDNIYLGQYSWSTFSAPALKSYENAIPEIESVSIVSNNPDEDISTIFHNEKLYDIKSIKTDSNFFKVFSPPVFKGNQEFIFSQPNSIVLTKSICNKIFQEYDVIGNQVTLMNPYSKKKSKYTIVSIIDDLPAASSLKFNAIVHDTALRNAHIGEWNMLNFIKLHKNSNANTAEKTFIDIVHKFYNESGFHFKQVPELSGFVPYSDIYLSPKVNSIHKKGNKTLINVFIGIAIFILVLASFNFINLFSSIANKRAKEIMLKKVYGASKVHLFLQLIIESLIITIVSFIISLIFLELFISFGFSWVDTSFDINLYNNHFNLVLYFFLGALTIGILTSIYPAFIISSFKPVNILNGILNKGQKGLFIRRALVSLQFVISIILIIGSIIVYKQIEYVRNKEIGFDKERVVWLDIKESIAFNRDVLVNELTQSPYIEAASYSSVIPGENIPLGGHTFKGKMISYKIIWADENFTEVLNIPIINGRDHIKSDKKAKYSMFIINKELSDLFGGMKANDIHNRIKVIGEIDNLYFSDPAHSQGAIGIRCIKNNALFKKLLIKIKQGNEKEALDHINKTWNKIVENCPTDIRFLNKHYDKSFSDVMKLSKLLNGFSFIIIFIACLGLFGLSAFMAEQRTKEIGIRKVLGAHEGGLIQMQAKEYLILVSIANIIAWPIAYYFMNDWLHNFVNHINFKWYFFALALTISLFITMITVSYMALKASRLNPIDVIKDE